MFENLHLISLCLFLIPCCSIPVGKDKDDLKELTNEDDFLEDFPEEEQRDKMWVYKSLKAEEEAYLNDIEKLYMAFIDHHGKEVPLLRNLDEEVHSLSFLVQPRELQPNTMVNFDS